MLKKMLMSALMLGLLTGAVAVAGEMAGMNHQMPDTTQMHWDAANDAAFLSGMIVHHQGAVDMTEEILKTTSKPEIRHWGEAILNAQRREIKEMQGLLDDIGEEDEAATAEMEAEMAMMMDRKVSDDADVNYIELMVPHHAGAIDMSVPALIMSDNPQIRKLAEDIIVAQAKEIAEFRSWLAKQEQDDRVALTVSQEI